MRPALQGVDAPSLRDRAARAVNLLRQSVRHSSQGFGSEASARSHSERQTRSNAPQRSTSASVSAPSSLASSRQSSITLVQLHESPEQAARQAARQIALSHCSRERLWPRLEPARTAALVSGDAHGCMSTCNCITRARGSRASGRGQRGVRAPAQGASRVRRSGKGRDERETQCFRK